MKILFLEWESLGKEDIKSALLAEGHSLVCFPFSLTEGDLCHDSGTEERMHSFLHQEVPDIVFSINYFPVISEVCNREKVQYVSWVYDSPYAMLYSFTVVNPCNIIYVFDGEMYLQFHNAGVTTVHYMPLAVSKERLEDLGCNPDADVPLIYDISFVGSLYRGKNNLFEKASDLSDYTKGYLDALMLAQRKVQGYNFIEETLGPVLEDLMRNVPILHERDSVESWECLYANYVVNWEITALERAELLKAIAQKYKIDLFTYDRDFTLPNLCNHGPVNYYGQMSWVFRQSRINLNISMRSIKSGIPLRAFDIMGSGGFLLSNYQADFLSHFVAGEDFVFYESEKDLLQKIEYYLFHEEEREAIARNGYEKVMAEHTYRQRVREMFSRW